MPDPCRDPFEGLVLDDAFVASARLKEPGLEERRRGRRVRRVRPWLGLAVQTVLVLSTALVLAVWSLTGFGARGGSGGAGPAAGEVSGSSGSAAGPLPVPEPWNDPVTELDVQVGPDWLAIGPPLATSHG